MWSSSLRFLLIIISICFSKTVLFKTTGLIAAERVVKAKSPEGSTVHSIRIEIQKGDKNSRDSSSVHSFLKNLQTQARSKFSQIEFDEDLKLLAKEFHTVEPAIFFQNNEIDILITVSEKPRIKNFNIVGNSVVETSKIIREGDFQEKKIFDRQLLFKGIQKIRSLYARKGYFEAEVTPKIDETAQGSVSITLEIEEKRAGFIEKIYFHNLSEIEIEQIRGKMATKEYSSLFSWLTRRGIYQADQFRHDEMIILSYLQNQGFLDAKVATSIKKSDTRDDRIVLDITADKGNIYRFGKIEVEGEQNIFTEEELLKRVSLHSGTPYSPDAVRAATKRLDEAFGSKGYIDAMVIPDAQRGDDPHIYNTTFRIRQGNRFRVGLIRIIGNRKTDISVILHEVPLTPGEIFDSTLLAKAEMRLFNVGFFKKVNIYAVKPEVQPVGEIPLRDIHIEVEENDKNALFTAFGGYNTTEGVSGGVTLSESNFKMSGMPHIFSKGFRAVRGGGEFVKFSSTLGTKQRSYSLSWTKPYFMDTDWALGVDLSKMNNEFASSDYTIKSKDLEISLKKNLNAFVNFGVNYRLHDGHINIQGMNHKEKKRERNRKFIRESKNGGAISAIGTSLGYDSTNHPVSPTTGLRSSIALEYAGLFGDHHFANIEYTNTLFIPVVDRGILKIKGNIGLIKTLFRTTMKKLPLDERLFLGGEGSVRGYRYNALGPLFRDKGYTPRGGLTSGLFSIEYEHRMMDRLGGFLFADAGNVWKKTLEFGRLKCAIGLGIKFYIAEGTPLTIGYGVPLNAQRKQDLQKFYFSIGGNF